MELENKWSKPEGVLLEGNNAPSPIVYTIVDGTTSKVVTRTTSVAYDHYTRSWHHAMHTDDQHYGNSVATIVQRACEYFYVPDEDYEPIEGLVFSWCGFCDHSIEQHRQGQTPSEVHCYGCEADPHPPHRYYPSAVSDDEVHERVRRLDLGENYREALGHSGRTNNKRDRYPLQELPWDVQRAMIEQLLALKRMWQVVIYGPVFTVAENGSLEYAEYPGVWEPTQENAFDEEVVAPSYSYDSYYYYGF